MTSYRAMESSRDLRLPVRPTGAWSSIAVTRKGLSAGIKLGAVASLVRVGYWLRPHPTEPFPPIIDATLQLVLPVIAGAIAGAAVGALWPWRRYRTTSILLGVGAAWLFAMGVSAGWRHLGVWTLWPVLISLGFAVMPGVVFGAAIFDDGRPVTPEEARREVELATRRDADPVVPWEVCPCCGYRTFVAVHAPGRCVLCEWDEETDGPELTLTQAQANFRQYASIYAPNHLPHWRTSPPSDEEAVIRRQIMSLLDSMEHERRPAELSFLWYQVHEHFETLSALSLRGAERDLDTPDA